MAAAAASAATHSFSLSLTLSSSDPPQFTHHHHHHQRLPFFYSPPIRKHPCLYSQPKQPHTFTTFSSSSSSSSHHPSSSSSSPSTSAATTKTATYSSVIEDTWRTGRFLTNEELEKLKTLEDFNFRRQLPTGSTLLVRVMRPEEMDTIVSLLAESFAESMLLPPGYETLLRFFVKQYLIKRRAVLPHAVTLIGFYKEKGDDDDDGDEEMELAGTVEVCFDKRGANSNPATPLPPKNSPYICNMAVKKPLRRSLRILYSQFVLISPMSYFKKVNCDSATAPCLFISHVYGTNLSCYR
ncbi:hypothetical protein Tsubulata_030932 [Turnera subulata]|uniref:Uncharacterized protein n=1 Tax=Turnera subulata TaxID=218843 RepID=A0A9Q0GCH1_9ROSI|nr:hypothetical protein Tsubulata_030932 [Turnera subulata]